MLELLAGVALLVIILALLPAALRGGRESGAFAVAGKAARLGCSVVLFLAGSAGVGGLFLWATTTFTRATADEFWPYAGGLGVFSMLAIVLAARRSVARLEAELAAERARLASMPSSPEATRGGAAEQLLELLNASRHLHGQDPVTMQTLREHCDAEQERMRLAHPGAPIGFFIENADGDVRVVARLLHAAGGSGQRP